MTEKKQHISTQIEINATPNEVWSVLTDFDTLAEWSTSFQGVSAPLELGTTSIAYYKNPLTGGKIAFEHEIIVYEEGKTFGWSGEAFMGAKDHHIFSIKELPNGKSLFSQEDGLYHEKRHLFHKMFEYIISIGYKKFNKELKERVESIYQK